MSSKNSRLNKIRQQLEEIRLQELQEIQTNKTAITLIISFSVIVIGLSLFIHLVLAIVVLLMSVLLYLSTIGDFSNYNTQVKSKFKRGIVQYLMRSINPNISYYPEKGIIHKHLIDAETLIIPDDDNRFEGEDCVRGKTTNGCSFDFAELIFHLENYHTPKRQFFFTLTTNYSLASNEKLIIRPIKGWWDKLYSNQLYSFSQSTNNTSLITDPNWNKSLQIFTDTKELIPQLLTPTTIKIINHWAEQFYTLPFITFKNDRIYILFDGYTDLFEPDIRESLIDNEVIERLHTEISSCFDLVEDFSRIEIDKNAILDYPDEGNSLLDHLIDDGIDS